MTDERVTISFDGSVADVRMNRPETINALDDAQFAAIVDAGESLKKTPGVRAVVTIADDLEAARWVVRAWSSPR